MNCKPRVVRIDDVFNIRGFFPQVIVGIEIPPDEQLELDEYWYFDPSSKSTWRFGGCPCPPRGQRPKTIALAPVSGDGKLVPGLELQLVPIGWQP